MNNTLRIGVLGLGTVGQGVWKYIQRKHSFKNIELVRASVRNLSKKRTVSIGIKQLTRNPLDIIDDKDIDIICELLGGIRPARELTLRAFKNGKTVVTANKALLCDSGAKLLTAAHKAGVSYFFDASVAGGIPLIKTMLEGLIANSFTSIYGILNGTSNYILTRIYKEYMDYESILYEARELGYVESNEELDIDGLDAAQKAIILAYIAYGKWIKPKDVLIDGIKDIKNTDINNAAELGYKIKPLVLIEHYYKKNGLYISIRVNPALIKKNILIAQIDGSKNGISLTGDIVGPTCLVGKGAGQNATTSSVISDIVTSLYSTRNLNKKTEEIFSLPPNNFKQNISIPYYLSFCTSNKPRILKSIVEHFTKCEVRISTIKHNNINQPRSILWVVITHPIDEWNINILISRITKLGCIAPQYLKIFDK